MRYVMLYLEVCLVQHPKANSSTSQTVRVETNGVKWRSFRKDRIPLVDWLFGILEAVTDLETSTHYLRLLER
jgi:hypothetical protein